MLDKSSRSKSFAGLNAEDTDLTMFTITNLTLVLEKEDNMVYMGIKLKRKVVTELVTTYLPTILLLLITYTTIFFDKDLFGDAIAVNLTIMLVMTTIFTSKIEELPPTSDTKMIDIWLIFCLIVPFLDVILRTAINSMMNCSCCVCKPQEKDSSKMVNSEQKEDSDTDGTSQEIPPREVITGVWLDDAVAKGDPQQVALAT